MKSSKFSNHACAYPGAYARKPGTTSPPRNFRLFSVQIGGRIDGTLRYFDYYIKLFFAVSYICLGLKIFYMIICTMYTMSLRDGLGLIEFTRIMYYSV